MNLSDLFEETPRLNFKDITTFKIKETSTSHTYRGPDVNAGQDVEVMINGERYIMSYTNKRVRGMINQIDKHFNIKPNEMKAKEYFESLRDSGYVFNKEPSK